MAKNAGKREAGKKKRAARKGRGTPAKPVVVVGIGASAGGLEAMEAFLKSLPPESGLGFVLVQHLDPSRGSILPELLAKYTKMRVCRAENGMVVSANCLYVNPSNAALTIQDGKLQISTPINPSTIRNQINTFFLTLAADQGENAIGIVLSGSGSDGRQGIKVIKENGGFCVVQAPVTAKYDSMPLNAIATGMVDCSLPVEEIPAKIIEHVESVTKQKRTEAWETTHAEIGRLLPRICACIQQVTGHDFNKYKQSTLVRRIERRVHLMHADTVGAYVDKLEQNREEVEQLFNDLLIGVTHFFRDPETFETLARGVIPRLLENKSQDTPVRIWVPGCASGEEAYTLAILLCEGMAKSKSSCLVQVFATDIDELALEVARGGRYPLSIAEHVTSERLERFFARQGDGYQVSKQLREMCVFSTHNLVRDPPFSSLDMISCRNLMIYLESDLQKRLVPLFHYALRPGGYLFLGPSEGLSAYPELFRVVDKKQRLFQAKEAVIRPPVEFPLMRSKQVKGSRPTPTKTSESLKIQDIGISLERIVLEEYAASSVVINERGDILYTVGDTSPYLRQPAGATTANIIDKAHKGLRLSLRTAIHRVSKTRQSVQRENVAVETPKGMRQVCLTVRPMPGVMGDSGLLAVVFQLAGVALESEKIRGLAMPVEESAIQQLETELKTAREELQTTVEELEAANEELKSSNEELLSMNEEMQSANEELQTSKEEMQSVNEELATVNSELNKKVEELDEANGDLQNLFRSTEIATLFLDRQLHIKRFTPAATAIFHLIESDIGRSIGDFSPRIAGGDLIAEMKSVLQTLATRERHIYLEESHSWYLLRILPSRTVADVIDGVVATFVDITLLKRAEEGMRESEAKYRNLFRNMAEEVHFWKLVRDEAGCIKTWRLVDANPPALQSWGKKLEDIRGKTTDEIFGPGATEHYLAIVQKIMTEGKAHSFEDYLPQLGKYFRFTSVPLGEYFITTGADITEIKQAQEALQQNEQRLRLALDAANAGTWEWDLRTNENTWSERLWSLYGLDPHSCKPSYEAWRQVIHPDDRDHTEQLVQQAAKEGAEMNFEFRVRDREGGERWLVALGRPQRDAAGQVIRYMGIVLDITARKNTEAQTRWFAQQRQLALDAARLGWWHYDPDTKIAIYDQRYREIFGVTGSQRPNDEILARLHPDDLPRVWAAVEAALNPTDPKPYFTEYRIFHDDGSIRWVEAYGVASFTGEGNARRANSFVGTVADITSRKQVEEALRKSEATYRSLFGNMLDGFAYCQMIYDEQGRPDDFIYLDVNNAFSRLTGLENVMGKKVTQVIPGIKEMSPEVFQIYGRVARTGVPERFEIDFKPLHSWLMVSVYSPEPGYFVALFDNITERKQAEEAQKHSEERLRFALETSHTGAWDLNLVDQTAHRSLEHDRIFGYEHMLPQWTYEMFLEHVLPEDREMVDRKFRHAMETKTDWGFECRIRRKDGEIRWILAAGRHRMDEKASMHHLAGIVQDITERKKTEDALANAIISAEHAKTAAETASKAKDHFLAVLSHELRTPLNPVLTTAAMLRDDLRLDPETRELMTVICRNAELEARLIDDLLDVTRIERCKIELTHQYVGLQDVIRRAVEVCRPEIVEKKLQFSMEMPEEQILINADPVRLQQVFWNLVKNAVKFTPAGKRMGIRCRPQGTEAVEVEVYDSGEGIEANSLERIFNAFEQAEHSIKRQFGGLGLGLTISKTLVEMHGGSIKALSEGKGKGARFLVWLPLQRQRTTHAEPRKTHKAPKPDFQISALKILLVEDHRDTAMIMRRLLLARKHEVEIAMDLASARKMLKEKTFDLLLSDLGLPDGSGLDLMRMLRKEGKSLPGIALSGYGLESDVQQSLQAGFFAHLIKPVNYAKLEEVMAQVVADKVKING